MHLKKNDKIFFVNLCQNKENDLIKKCNVRGFCQ